MRDIRIITGRTAKFDPDQTVRLLGCRPGSDSWEQTRNDVVERMPVLRRLTRPKGAFVMETDEGKTWIYAMMTLGKAVTDYIDRLGEDGDASSALILNAMADSCLFSFEEELQQALRSFCREKNCGISRRYEIGTDLPLLWQQRAYDGLAAGRTLGLKMTADYMLVPEKSMSLAFLVSTDPAVFHAGHDCRMCHHANCCLRQQPYGESQKSSASPAFQEYTCPSGQNLADSLRGLGELPALCGGKGTCGRCGIRLVEGTLPVTKADREFYTEQELKDGWRLACQAVPDEPVRVRLPMHHERQMTGLHQEKAAAAIRTGGDYGLAIDLGSTTIAASLVSLSDGTVLESVSSVNRQRTFGADVVSRIAAACDGHAKELQKLAIESIEEAMDRLLSPFPGMRQQLRRMTLAGNTTMEHLLMGWPCNGLGSWPFHPVSLGGNTLVASDLFGDALPASCTLTVLPGFSTYVGADIASGLIACAMDRTDTESLFLDLGTNGEMALGTGQGILVASTAAGPALEGGQLRCGMSSVPGAICSVTWNGSVPSVRTISDSPPRGLCGTGVIEAMAGLVKQGIVDRHGTLREPWFTRGFPLAQGADGAPVVLTQADIRQIQMAKSAIRAGISVLLRTAGLREDDVKIIWLAGGFGYYLKPDAAAAIGLIPPSWTKRTRAAGNTSLMGAVQALTDPGAMKRMTSFIQKGREVVLGNTADFQSLYIQHMDFTNKTT